MRLKFRLFINLLQVQEDVEEIFQGETELTQHAMILREVYAEQEIEDENDESSSNSDTNTTSVFSEKSKSFQQNDYDINQQLRISNALSSQKINQNNNYNMLDPAFIAQKSPRLRSPTTLSKSKYQQKRKVSNSQTTFSSLDNTEQEANLQKKISRKSSSKSKKSETNINIKKQDSKDESKQPGAISLSIYPSQENLNEKPSPTNTFHFKDALRLETKIQEPKKQILRNQKSLQLQNDNNENNISHSNITNQLQSRIKSTTVQNNKNPGINNNNQFLKPFPMVDQANTPRKVQINIKSPKNNLISSNTLKVQQKMKKRASILFPELLSLQQPRNRKKTYDEEGKLLDVSSQNLLQQSGFTNQMGMSVSKAKNTQKRHSIMISLHNNLQNVQKQNLNYHQQLFQGDDRNILEFEYLDRKREWDLLFSDKIREYIYFYPHNNYTHVLEKLKPIRVLKRKLTKNQRLISKKAQKLTTTYKTLLSNFAQQNSQSHSQNQPED